MYNRLKKSVSAYLAGKAALVNYHPPSKNIMGVLIVCVLPPCVTARVGSFVL